MRRLVVIASIVLLFAPLPFVAVAAHRALADLDRRDREGRASAASRAFLAEVRAAAVGDFADTATTDVPGWVRRTDRASLAVDEGVWEEALGDPAFLRARGAGAEDLVIALEALDRLVIGAGLDEAIEAAAAAPGPASDAVLLRYVAALLDAAAILRDAGRAAEARTLVEIAEARRIDVGLADRVPGLRHRIAAQWAPPSDDAAAAPRPRALAARWRRARPADPVGVAAVEAWFDEVSTRPTSLAELALLERVARDDAGVALGDALRARATRPLLLDAVADLDPRGLLVARTPFGWATVTADAIRTGPDVERLAREFRGEEGETVRFTEDGLTPPAPGVGPAALDDSSGSAGRGARNGSADGRAVLVRAARLEDLALGVPRGDGVAGALIVEVPRGSALGGLDPAVVVGVGIGGYAVLAGALLLAIRRQLAQRDRLVRARDDLIAQVAHELRTPLTVLRLYGESLEEGRVPPAGRGEYLRALGTETRRLGALVDRMVRAVREEDAREDHPSAASPPLELERALAPALRDHRRVAVARGGVVNVHLAAGTWVRVDEDDLRLLVDVLVDNAFKYGGEPPRVDVSLATETRSGRRVAVLRVRDHGPGLARGEEGRVFERFARGEAGRRASRGAGMGLFLARTIARRLGGDVQLANASGARAADVPGVAAPGAGAPSAVDRVGEPAPATAGPGAIAELWLPIASVDASTSGVTARDHDAGAARRRVETEPTAHADDASAAPTGEEGRR